MCVLGENCDSRHSHEISIKTVTYMTGYPGIMYNRYLRWVIADKQNQLVVMLIILGQTGLVRCNWAQKSQDYCTFQYILRPYLGLWQFHIWCTFKCNFMGDVPFGVFWTRSVVILWVICVIAGHISHFLALMLHVPKITWPKKNTFLIK